MSSLLLGVLAVAAALAAPGAAPKRRDVGTVAPQWPPLWHRPAERSTTIDYAAPAQADAWLRHPILGDPSFDSFQRASGNPIIRGSDPFRWPVNVSLLIDPVSNRWYAYVGLYLEGYAFGPGKPVTHCEVYRSADQGRSWEHVGPIFDDPGFRFEGDQHPAGIAPDVCVVYHGGRYHMSYDWATNNTDWGTASTPSGGADGGSAYAWSERPEGPFHRNPRPILRTSDWQRSIGTATRYRRVYATSLIRRAKDWLVISDLDSGGHFAWGQIAMTAKDPAGPWSRPVMIAGLEGDRYYPAPIEAFPSFAHQGYVYDPRTSVGRSRNFQAIMRAPIEQADSPDAWELWQHGSVWHSEPNPNEAYGIWGQTLAGRVDGAGMFHALYPSRHAEGGVGTIGAASRPWATPLRKAGFTFSAHGGGAVSIGRAAYGAFELEAGVRLASGAAQIAWGCRMPLGADGRADGRPHELSMTRHHGLELTAAGWRLLEAGDAPGVRVIAEGSLAPAAVRTVRLSVGGGRVAATISGKRVWAGALPAAEGPLGLLLEPGAHLTVDRLKVTGVPRPASHAWLYTEAISGAGVAEGAYVVASGARWRWGVGAVCKSGTERVKWNFRGRGFRLWLPRGPRFGRAAVRLDGAPLGEIDLAGPEAASSVALERLRLSDGFHALVVTGLSGEELPVDCLEALQ